MQWNIYSVNRFVYTGGYMSFEEAAGADPNQLAKDDAIIAFSSNMYSMKRNAEIIATYQIDLATAIDAFEADELEGHVQVTARRILQTEKNAQRYWDAAIESARLSIEASTGFKATDL